MSVIFNDGRAVNISGSNQIESEGISKFGRPEILNISGLPLEQIYSWLPRGITAEKIVFFPDACPTGAPLPTGVAVKLKSADWRKYAVSDCGCGMQLLESGIKYCDFQEKDFYDLGLRIKNKKGSLGDLGRGNHFLDAIVSLSDEKVYFLIHTGSLKESGMVDKLVDKPRLFDKKFAETVEWARMNRDTLGGIVSRHFGKCKLVLDLPHNTFEKQEDHSVIIRKGAVKVSPGDLTIIPSSMDGGIVLVQAGENVTGTLNSLCHGTGRALARSEAKALFADFDFSDLRKRICIPGYISDESLRSDAPYSYRKLEDCLNMTSDLLQVKERFSVIGYLGHL